MTLNNFAPADHGGSDLLAGLSAASRSGPGLSRPGPSGTGLSGTGLSGTGLSGTGLSGTGLSGTGLSGASLPGAGLAGTGLAGASLSGAALLSKVGHELRSSLTGIVGLARMLLLRLDAPPVDVVTQRRQLTMVRDGAEATLHTVERVIELARIAIGQHPVVPTSVDCHHAVTAVVEALQPAATSRRLLLQVSPPVGSPTVDTDERLLRRVVHELLDNAIRFTDGEAVWIEVVGTDDGTTIGISDDGPGIDVAERAQIFEPFTRGEAAMRHDDSGAGLGLYLAHRLANLLGAELAVTERSSSAGSGSAGSGSAGSGSGTERSGRGSTFTVRLPRVRAAATDRAESEPRS